MIGDHPQRPFQTRELTIDWTFVRFHTGRGRDGNYGDKSLTGWAEQIREWRRRIDVFAYFNNDRHGFAIANAQTLTSLLQQPRQASERSGPPRSRSRSRPRAA